jgi:hypothetical protein
VAFIGTAADCEMLALVEFDAEVDVVPFKAPDALPCDVETDAEEEVVVVGVTVPGVEIPLVIDTIDTVDVAFDRHVPAELPFVPFAGSKVQLLTSFTAGWPSGRVTGVNVSVQRSVTTSPSLSKVPDRYQHTADDKVDHNSQRDVLDSLNHFRLS